jgi:hypothetical protein
MKNKAATVDEYLASLPEDRRDAVQAVREVILQHLPEGYEEGMQYGMISYYVPFSRLAKTYNGQPLGYVALASQKNYMSLYLTGVYASEALAEWFVSAYKQTGKKLDMGKSCVRFKKLSDLPLDVVGQAVAKVSVDELIHIHNQTHGGK